MAKQTLRSVAGAAEDQFKAGAKKIRGQLAQVEKAVEELATKAKEQFPSPSDVKAELPGVRRRLREATSSVRKRKGPAKAAEAAASTGSGPDDSWTVADLRAEAKKRGLSGYSRKSKAELLAELRG